MLKVHFFYSHLLLTIFLFFHSSMLSSLLSNSPFPLFMYFSSWFFIVFNFSFETFLLYLGMHFLFSQCALTLCCYIKVGFETCVSCFLLVFFFVPLFFGLLEYVMHLYSYIIIFLKNCVIDAIFSFVCSLISSSKVFFFQDVFLHFVFSYVCSCFQSVLVTLDYGFFFSFQCAFMSHYHVNTFVIFSLHCFAHSTYVSKFMFCFLLVSLFFYYLFLLNM